MSGWQDYLKLLMDSASSITQSALIGKEDASLWAKTPDSFAITADECKAIVKAFANWQDIPANGITVAGVKYIVPTAEETFFMGKKGLDGVFASYSDKAIVLATFTGTDATAGTTTRAAVESIVDTLKQSGF